MAPLKLVDLHPDLTPRERIEALARVSLQDKDQLKRWLVASGRSWLTFNALDLVDGLRWPDGIDALMQLVACYRNHRAAIETGRYEEQVEPTLGHKVRVPVYKGEGLEVEELAAAVRAMVAQIRAKDPSWNLENLLS